MQLAMAVSHMGLTAADKGLQFWGVRGHVCEPTDEATGEQHGPAPGWLYRALWDADPALWGLAGLPEDRKSNIHN